MFCIYQLKVQQILGFETASNKMYFLFLEVSADIMKRVVSIFYRDPITAAMKVLGVN